MKYIFKNIKLFIKNETMIFFLVIISTITSSFIIIFSYGLYQSYITAKSEENNKTKGIMIDIFDTDSVTKEKLKNCLFSISDKTNDHITMYIVSPVVKEFDYDKWRSLYNRFTVKNGEIASSDLFENNLRKNGNLISGYYFTDEQERNGELVALARINSENFDIDFTEQITTRVEGEKRWIQIQGKEYEVIGWHNQEPIPYFPFESLDETTTFQNYIDILFDRPVRRSEYKDIKNNFEKTFDSAVRVPNINIPENENIYFYNTILIISILIAFLASVNFSMLYKYVLSKRTNMLTVFRICGCTKSKTIIFFLVECMIITIPLFIITTIIYDKFLLLWFGNYIEYISEVYDIKIYLTIFAIYAITSLMVLITMIKNFLQKTICEAKGGK